MANESGSLKWRIYYDDGSTVDSSTTTADQSPKLGVIAVVQTDPERGRIVIHRFDFYWYEHGEFWGSDIFGLWDYLTRPGMKVVLFGRTVATALYSEIVQRACNDTDFEAR